MAAERALALVIRGTDWSETSRITTLFTREHGKVRALAKGGRRIKSNFEVAFDLLSVCEVMYLRKAHGGLDLLTEARTHERFPRLRTDLKSLYVGYYIAELLADGTFDYDPHPELFDAALANLRTLGEPAEDPLRVASRFELVWLRELGYSPRIDSCVACGAGRPELPRYVISLTLGGFVCPVCAPGVNDRRTVSMSGLQTVRELTAGGPLPTTVKAEVRAWLGQSVSAVLGRRPKMLAYLDGTGLRPDS